MNLQGRPCTLYPFTAEGIVLSRGFDMRVVARAFHTAVEEELERAGLGVKLAGPDAREVVGAPAYAGLVPDVDAPDEGIVVTGRFVTVKAGSRLLRYLAPFLGGAPAIVEVEGRVADRDIPLADLNGLGKRGLGPFGGASMEMLTSAAGIAGMQLARQALKTLVG